MLDPKNLINLAGGVISDPEVINDNIVKFRIGVDYAGSEKSSDNNSGYFDVVYYLKNNGELASKNASFVSSQISSSKMKKGSQIQIIGRLMHERWKQDDAPRSRVVIVAEHISYYGSAAPGSKSSDTSDSKPVATSSNSSASKASFVPTEF
jgi:single-stranded DNA-binding protein